MKICFPVESDKGLDSEVFGHFGSAPIFIVFNTETKTIDTINNQDLGHVHGMCNPLKALDGNKVDVVIVGGIGAGAIKKLNQMGTKIYKSSKATIKDNLELFENKALSELTAKHACGGHGGDCGHNHNHGDFPIVS
jgi:predicted Fe-Mo cluster-binding NifX family protein